MSPKFSDLCHSSGKSMPTAFEIGMSIQFVGWIAAHVMVIALGFPKSRLYHYLYDGDELFTNKS